MPFTLSHTLAILPFRKYLNKHFSLSGLLMGSMAPDFEYFIRITLYACYGHTWWGIFWFDLPLSVLLCLIFHQIIKIPLINHLPFCLYQRLNIYKKLNWLAYLQKNFLKVCVSIILGTLTHFIWDNFTHEPNHISPFYFNFLLTNIHLFNKDIALYQIFQILSSILGILAFPFFIFQLPIINQPQNQTKKNIFFYWLKIVILSIIIVYVRYIIGVPAEKPNVQLVVITISALLMSLTLISLQNKKYHET